MSVFWPQELVEKEVSQTEVLHMECRETVRMITRLHWSHWHNLSNQ